MRTTWVSSVWGLLTLCVLTSLTALAGPSDWPQWRGPKRDGHAAEQKLAQSWTGKGPALKWEFNGLGVGYSSVSVADGKLYTMGEIDEKSVAICLDSGTGKPLWQTTIARAGVRRDYNRGWGGGPRSTPTVDGDQIFVLSAIGVVAALQRDTGALLWKVDLVADHGGSIPKWGYSESVLIDGDRVVVKPGGKKFMVALDRKTGDLLWQSQGIDALAHYASALKGTFAGTDYYVTAAGIGVIGLDRNSGEKLFENSMTGNDIATIPTPLIIGNDQIYHTSDYGSGNALLKLRGKERSGNGDGTSAEVVYHLNRQSMQNHHGGVVLVDGVIYGFTQTDGGTWMAQDLASGETLWQKKLRGNTSGSIAYADGRLYCYNDGDGSLILLEPSRQEFKQVGQLQLPRETSLPRNRGAIWTPPVIADQTLFIRDQNLLFAFDIKR